MTDIVRILLIDDDQEDYLIVSDMLADAENSRFKLSWVQTYEAGLEAIARRSTTSISLIISWAHITVSIF